MIKNVQLTTKEAFLLQTGTIPPGVTASGAKYPLNLSDEVFQLENYVVEPIRFQLSETTGSFMTGPTGDDVVGGPYDIGFTFSFYSNQYSQLYVSTNGYVVFGSTAGHRRHAGHAESIPTGTGGTLKNFIALPWSYLEVDTGGITYFTEGEIPNRKFILNFTGNYTGFSGETQVSQLKLFETSDEIEIHLSIVNNTTSDKVLGIQDSTGEIGSFPRGRNGYSWNILAPEAWRFSPPKASGFCFSKIFRDSLELKGDWRGRAKAGDLVQLTRGTIKNEYTIKNVIYSPVELVSKIYLANNRNVVYPLDPFLGEAGYGTAPSPDVSLSFSRKTESPNLSSSLVKNFVVEMVKDSNPDTFSLKASWEIDPSVSITKLRWRSTPRYTSYSLLDFSVNPGGEYSNVPSATVVSDTGRKAQIQLTTEISDISLASGGTGYTYASAYAIGGGGTGASFSVGVSGGSVIAVSVTSGGYGYTSLPQISILGDGLSASAYVSKVSPTGVEILQQGGNYLSVPNVVVDSTYLIGTPSVVEASLSLQNEGKIDYIRVENEGSGYTGASVNVYGSAQGDEAQAEVEIVDGKIANIKLLSPGYGYCLPIVEIVPSGTGGSGASAVANVDLYSTWVYEEPSAYGEFEKILHGFKYNVPYEIEILASADKNFKGLSKYSNLIYFQYYK